jgi:hypothetical protein
MKPRKQKFISLKRVRNKFLRAAKRNLPAIDRLAETKACPVKPQKGKKYLMGKYSFLYLHLKFISPHLVILLKNDY